MNHQKTKIMKKRAILILSATLMLVAASAQTKSSTSASKEEQFFNGTSQDSLSKEDLFFRQAKDKQVREENLMDIRIEAYLKQKGNYDENSVLAKKLRKEREARRKEEMFFRGISQQERAIKTQDSLKYEAEYRSLMDESENFMRETKGLGIYVSNPFAKRYIYTNNSETDDFYFDIVQGNQNNVAYTNTIFYIYSSLEKGVIKIEIYDPNEKLIDNLIVAAKNFDTKSIETTKDLSYNNGREIICKSDSDAVSKVQGAFIKSINNVSEGTWHIKVLKEKVTGEVNLLTTFKQGITK